MNVAGNPSCRRQEIVAKLGQQALETDDIDQLLSDAVAVVAETLEVEYVGIFEVADDTVCLRAGVGWQADRIGTATLAIDSTEQIATTLRSDEPVVVENGWSPAGDSDDGLLDGNELTSSVTAVIGPVSNPWGVLAAYATDRQAVAGRDGPFVQSVATTLGSVVENADIEHEFAEMHDRVSDGFYSLDEQWRFTYLNNHAEELIDFTHDGLVGTHIWETFEWAADSKLETEYERAMQTQEPTSFEFYAPEPLERWYEINVYPSETGLSVYFRDISERKTIEQELRATNRTLRRLYEITAAQELSFDEKVHQLLELGRDRLGLEVGFVANVDEDADRFEVVHATGDDDRLQPGSVTSLSETYCRRTIDADDLLVRTNIPADSWADDPVYERWDFDAYVGGKVQIDDNLYGTLCFADETARAESFSPAERQFVRLAMQWLGFELERQHRQRQLETALEDLEASNERLEQFAYVVSHDLQEPLRMISSYLSLLEQRYGDELDDDADEFLEFTVDGAERMQAMIDGLLEYSRIETRGNPLEPTDLETVLEDVRTDLQLQIDDTDTNVTVNDLPTVAGDSAQLRQLFQNLLSNAIAYSGDDPPTVEIDAERRDASEPRTDATEHDGDQWIVSVRDDGIGIDPDQTDRIFEIFQRLHTYAEHPGTGIGLALCRRIVDRHGGEIWVDTEPGVGSTFSVALPAVD
ncbi:GAF domain-containing protein [Salinadaptatus halalkaliphilus]|uniref:histidine kinase n=1 Tax=Salinadaptatus halalkaliphilus TaxID=2419781 RepID=A0A4S3TMH0_9EURY|nr:ATP-binding protein [Salinadaptatus halalkaliphilus]THE64235.1 GAF domain-containing protein [Salinadaptatus halalkaliphilus]